MLYLQEDFRRYILLSTFGFYQGGILDVKFNKFLVGNGRDNEVVGCFGYLLFPTYLNGRAIRIVIN